MTTVATRDPNEYIFENRHADLADKEKTWNLIFDSYIGGTKYYDGEYLEKYPKESTNSFDVRKKRACYFNQVSPVVDMLSGLLFLNAPTRKVPKELEFLKKKTSKDKDLNEFMRIVAAYSLMFTCGILIDSPDFDYNEIKTEADRKSQNLNPYAVLYMPSKVRDFYAGENGELQWVILDNSYFDHTDPFSPGEEKTIYRLWTTEYYQDFEKKDKSTIIAGEKVDHNVGYVPFNFISWRDDNSDFIGETIFEDIAQISKLIYNSMSYMDEMLASGTFRMLTYPSKDGSVPPELTSGGVGALSVIPYFIESNKAPSFIGATLGDIAPFIKAIEFYMAEILKKVGLSTDETKEFVKSGVAKKIDFQKMRALLVSGASAMSKIEGWIFKTAAKWNGSKDKVEKIEYNTSFSSEDLRLETQMLTELLNQPIKTLRKEVLKLLVKKQLGNDLDDTTLGVIYTDINENFDLEAVSLGFNQIQNMVSAQKKEPKIDNKT